ncbi:GGDEF domain-containing phosphodiesterase [Acidovorax sp.]|uniref:putative bifunctional diguanylate cyclase/phosphodiesterase n=1 Tax=Acidovorax sp. TaxID=1872122 RepID=UPI0025C1E1F8|nr:GGDEF domain-containing phosphodiesterase [Acidovorax sp.]
MPSLKPSSLTAKTLAWVVVASSMAFAAITVVAVSQERALLLKRAHEQAQSSVQQNLPALSDSLWNFNNSSLHALLTGMVGEGVIVRADVLDGERTVMSVSRPGELPPVDTTWTTPIADPGSTTPGRTQLGEIRVYESYAALRAQQAETAWRIAIAQLLQIASIAAILVVIVRWLIMRHLSALARAVGGLNPLDNQDRIRLQRRATGGQPDELDALVDALNRFHTERATEAQLRLRAEQALLARVKEIEATLGALSDGVLALNGAGEVVYANDAAARLMGMAEQDLHRQPWQNLFRLLDETSGEMRSEWLAKARQTGMPQRVRGELRIAPAHARAFVAELNAVPLHNPGDVELLLVLRDISEEIDRERQIVFQAFHDPLTGLGNRSKLARDLPQDLGRSRDTQGRLALLFIDLDNFKDINDTLGHQVGDLLLRQLALRLQATVMPPAWVTRHGGDEFLVVLPQLGGDEQAIELAQELMNQIRRPFALEGYQLHVTPSVGISLFPDHGSTPAELVSRADMGMYAAKKLGRNTYCVFDDRQLQESSRRLSVENGLRTALAQGEFWLAFQPKVELATGRVVGAEALLRWESRQLGRIPPASFIPIAEESGLIIDIGDWVLREAIAAARRWRDILGTEVPVAVNVAAAQFRSPRLLQTLRAIAAEDRDIPRLVQLEVTESALISGLEDVTGKFIAIKELGYSIAIDDFGTGYSSLSYLKNLPVDTLKIDQAFIRDLHRSTQDVTIVSAVVRMGQSLGFAIVAEGVEEARHVQILQDLGCDQGQGYHFSRPVPESELLPLLQKGCGTIKA